MPGNWQGSDRQSTLPPHWATHIRPAVLTRDHGRCTWLHQHEDGDGGFPTYLAGRYPEAQRCPHPASDVDHWGERYDHRVESCRSLCTRHHAHRSSRQGNAARARQRALLTTPKRPHPGLLPKAEP